MGHANLEGKAGCQGQAKAGARVGQDEAAKGVCSAGTLDVEGKIHAKGLWKYRYRGQTFS